MGVSVNSLQCLQPSEVSAGDSPLRTKTKPPKTSRRDTGDNPGTRSARRGELREPHFKRPN